MARRIPSSEYVHAIDTRSIAVGVHAVRSRSNILVVFLVRQLDSIPRICQNVRQGTGVRAFRPSLPLSLLPPVFPFSSAPQFPCGTPFIFNFFFFYHCSMSDSNDLHFPSPGEIVRFDFRTPSIISQSLSSKDTVHLVTWNIERGYKLQQVLSKNPHILYYLIDPLTLKCIN
jgi:hypothetical protein